MGRVYFISDMHLGASYFPERHAHERLVVSFLESIASDADELYMLGDVLDYWFEYRYVVPRGYVRFFGALARLADRGVKIHWFTGNHDIWLFDYLRDEIGIEVVDGYAVRDILGKRFFLNHGDGVGKVKPSFRFLRSLFRNKFCQKLYSGIHPRWTVGFAHSWSCSSRRNGSAQPDLKQPLTDDPLVAFSKEYLRDVDQGIDYFVYGHRHVLLDYQLPGSRSRVIILGDWISHFTYGVFDGETFSLNTYSDAAIEVPTSLTGH